MKRMKLCLAAGLCAAAFLLSGCDGLSVGDEDDRQQVQTDEENNKKDDESSSGGDTTGGDTSGTGDTTTTVTPEWTGSHSSDDWWGCLTGDTRTDFKVAEGVKASVTFTVQSDTSNNWGQLPVVVLCDSAAAEYGVVRGDNYGWNGSGNTGDNLETLGWTLTSDWDWPTFITFTNGCTCTVSVTNWGNGKATVRYDCSKDGTTHYQQFADIAVTEDNLYFNLMGDAGTAITFTTE